MAGAQQNHRAIVPANDTINIEVGRGTGRVSVVEDIDLMNQASGQISELNMA